MSVIARKIAVANEPSVERPDEARLAERVIEATLPVLQKWLSFDELDIECRSADWNSHSEDQLSDMLVAGRGPRRAQQLAISASPALANFAVASLLGMGGVTDPEALAALRPFALQNIVAFGERMNATSLLSSTGDVSPEWAAYEAPTLLDNMEPYDTLNLDLALIGPGLEGASLRLLITADLLIADEDDAAGEETKPTAPLPPRLGPCHVQVRAIGDRVSLSVADCTRLEIGQIVALPGLRFDRLDLDVQMGDGPVLLTDAALGADKGQKAVRLNKGLDPAFRQKPEILTKNRPTELVPE